MASADPIQLSHVKGAKSPFRVHATRGGDALPVSTASGHVWAGLQSFKSTASSSAAFKRFAVTVIQPSTGVLSGTIPHTGINWTGASELRVWLTGSPRTFLGEPVPVRVRALSSNWVT